MVKPVNDASSADLGIDVIDAFPGDLGRGRVIKRHQNARQNLQPSQKKAKRTRDVPVTHALGQRFVQEVARGSNHDPQEFT